MLNRFLAVAITYSLALTIAMPVSASPKSKAEEEGRFAEKVRAGVARLGVGPEAKVEVKLRNKTKLSGFISAANDNSFVITAKDGTTTAVAYPDVAQVKGNNLAKGTKIVLIAAIVAGALAILYFSVFAGKHL